MNTPTSLPQTTYLLPRQTRRASGWLALGLACLLVTAPAGGMGLVPAAAMAGFATGPARSPEPPDRPTGLKAVASAENGIKIVWQPAADANAYTLEVANQRSGPFQVLAETAGTSFNHGGLAGGTTRFYRLLAANYFGTSGYSDVVQATSFTSAPAQPQAAAMLWNRRFGGTKYESIAAAIPTADGGLLLAGNSNSGLDGDKSQDSRGESDYWIVKLDANGKKQWDKRFGGSSYDAAVAVQQTPDGGYLVGGRSWSEMGGDKSQGSQGESDYWVVKIDGSGNKQWDKRYGGGGRDDLAALVRTGDGGFLLGGYSMSSASGNKSHDNYGEVDYWVVKIDGSGNQKWDNHFGGSHTDILTAMTRAKDGSGYLLAGYSSSGVSGNKTQGSQGQSDYWVVKIDGSGNKQWDKRYGGSSMEEPHAVIATQDNGYLVGGWSWSGAEGNKTQDSRGGDDYWAVKIDGSGNKQWDKRYGGNGSDQLYSLAQNSDGSYLLAGSSTTGADGDKLAPNRGGRDYWMLKTDGNGNKLWDRNFGGTSADYLAAVAAQPDGYLLAGYSASGAGGDKSQFNRGDHDFWVVKTTLGSYSGAITGLSLYNALTDAYLAKFTNDYTITLDAPGTSKLSVKALTSGSIGSVQFKLDGVVIRTENAAPYAIAGDSPKADGGTDFLPWTPSPGYHQLVVTPYKGSNGTGLVGTPYGVKFRVINSSIRVGTGVAAGGTEPEMAAPEVDVYPNPFAEGATLSFRLPESGPVSLTLHDTRGNLVRTLHQGEAGAGRQYQYPFHRAGLEAGVYFGRLVAGHRVVTKKIVILR